MDCELLLDANCGQKVDDGGNAPKQVALQNFVMAANAHDLDLEKIYHPGRDEKPVC